MLLFVTKERHTHTHDVSKYKCTDNSCGHVVVRLSVLMLCSVHLFATFLNAGCDLLFSAPVVIDVMKMIYA